MAKKLIRKKQIDFKELLPEDLPFVIDQGDGVAVGYNGDYELVPLSTIGGTHGVATGLFPGANPINTVQFASSFSVLVNGVAVDLANGTGDLYDASCYFSLDGATASPINQISTGKQLYWNSEIAGYDLDPSTDVISFKYEIGNPLYSVGPPGPQGGKGNSGLLINGTLAGTETSDAYFLFEGVAMDVMPFTAFDDINILAVSFASQTTDSWSVKIYKNAILEETSTAPGGSGDSYYDIITPITLIAGDTLSFEFDHLGDDILTPRVSLYAEVI